ncbi:hypothetical protein [Kitasatospora sp. NPDC087314]|uniref:hypothetical protein n=1 Tax=Kitasatospora sp. NPDC087314 TaxID=3364068 RepID=UPI0037F89504
MTWAFWRSLSYGQASATRYEIACVSADFDLGLTLGFLGSGGIQVLGLGVADDTFGRGLWGAVLAAQTAGAA